MGYVILRLSLIDGCFDEDGDEGVTKTIEFNVGDDFNIEEVRPYLEKHCGFTWDDTWVISSLEYRR